MEMLDQNNRSQVQSSLNDSREYFFGMGRDSVVSKSIRISKEKGIQSAQLLTRKATLA
jgi:hypothetical protein